MQEVSRAELDALCRERRTFALFVYTPMCGTCQLAKRMLTVAQEALPAVPVYQINLNGTPSVAERWQITSVPALLLFADGEPRERHFALHSAPFLYEVLQSLA